MNHLNISLLPSLKSIIRVMIARLIDSDNIIYLHSLNINFYNTCSIGLLHEALKPVFGFVALIAVHIDKWFLACACPCTWIN